MDEKESVKGITLVLGVIGSDVHAIGNKILEYALKRAGFHVVNLGVMVSQEEFIGAAVECAADAILVSSLYGHAELDCRGMREKCNEAGLKDILLYIGGNLMVGKRNFEEVERHFKEMGFDRVYPPSTLPDVAICDLRNDIAARRAAVGARVAREDIPRGFKDSPRDIRPVIATH